MSSLFGSFTQDTSHSDVERLNYILRTVSQKSNIIVPVQVISVDLKGRRLVVTPMIQQVTTDGHKITHPPPPRHPLWLRTRGRVCSTDRPATGRYWHRRLCLSGYIAPQSHATTKHSAHIAVLCMGRCGVYPHALDEQSSQAHHHGIT